MPKPPPPRPKPACSKRVPRGAQLANNNKAHGEVIEQQFTWEGMRRGLTLAKPEGDTNQSDPIAARAPNYPKAGLPRLVTVQVRAVGGKPEYRRGYTVGTRVGKSTSSRRPL